MVLESMFSVERVLERKPYAFLLGILYSLVSIAGSLFLFPENFIVFSIALISLLFLPMINRLLEKEKDIEKRSGKLSLESFIREHRGILQIYMYIFLGIALTFMAFSIAVPKVMLNHLFSNQADMTFSLYADPRAMDFGDFFLIIGNNMKVLIVCYLFAYFFGAGAIFIITWNASVWGTIFGTILKNASMSAGWNPLLYFLFMSIAVLPYLIIEASAYFLGGISGGMVSKALESEGLFSKKFENIIKKSLLMIWLAFFLLFLAAVVESQLTPRMVGLLFG